MTENDGHFFFLMYEDIGNLMMGSQFPPPHFTNHESQKIWIPKTFYLGLQKPFYQFSPAYLKISKNKESLALLNH